MLNRIADPTCCWEPNLSTKIDIVLVRSIAELKGKKDSILINNHLKALASNGKIHGFEGENIPYIRAYSNNLDPSFEKKTEFTIFNLSCVKRRIL